MYQRLDSTPDLVSQLIGDFLLLEGAPGEQSLQGLVGGHIEEALHAQQAAKGLQGQGFLGPE